MFPQINSRQSFPALEREMLAYWKANNTFQKSLEIRKDSPEFNFYDGPPFATGTPHYGHLLAGTIKDVIPRYQTMQGKFVERRFGWDCHGLPIENIVEKKLGISGKKDIEDKIGVFAFNEECRANVFQYTDVWRQTVERMGRWVDMDNDYKTMDTDFMESVWWVFKSIYDKGYVYESYRVVPYCPRCSTPLSNFEVNQGYEDKQDKAVTVKFKVKGTASKYILAWTTTPWTLPANLGLAVGTELIYAEILDKATGETYVLAKDRIATYYKNPEDYTLVREYPGSCLVGLSYEPMFDDFQKWENFKNHLSNEESWLNLWFISKEDALVASPKDSYLGASAYKVVPGHHVTTDSGTGVVHIAPAYGVDDAEIGEKEGLGFFSHIDAIGHTEHLLENNDVYVFNFNQIVIDRLKAEKKLIHIGTIDHSYPHCYRCHTPLIYRAISAWYVNVESLKDRMIANNQKVNWTPDNIKNGRFGKWLENARDWNISRNRYWGSAIPVWKSEDGDIIVIGSIKELYEANREFGDIVYSPRSATTPLSRGGQGGVYTFKDGREIDIHKHFVDTIKLSKDGKTYTRIPEVLDCWFESGSMPYASKHYPFEGTADFKFPADFIAEGLDQTRGWFYTLLILGTALFDNTPFLNVIVNGLILAEDGKKMSKSLKNYPDPMELIERHGADALRFYMLSSPVVKADDLRFSEAGVEEVVKKVLLPLWNTYSFFTTYANIDAFEPKKNGEAQQASNKLDTWILSRLNTLVKSVSTWFESYDLQIPTRAITEFMDDLTNWYIRRSRRRFWKSENDGDKMEAYETFYHVLVTLTKVMAPITPMISEAVYRGLTGSESVHLERFPECTTKNISDSLEADMQRVRDIIALGLALRGQKKIRVRQPLASITIGENLSEYFQEIICEELNVKEVKIEDMSHVAKKICKPNAKLIGPRFWKAVQDVIIQAKSGNFQELADGRIQVGEFVLEAGEYEIAYEPLEGVSLDVMSGTGMVIAMDTVITEELELEGYARDIVRVIQDLRKDAGYEVSDRVRVALRWEKIEKILSLFSDYITSETLSVIDDSLREGDISREVDVEGITVNVVVKR